MQKIRTPYDIALARGEFELAEVLDGSMTAQEAREYYTQKIAALYGVRYKLTHYGQTNFLGNETP